MTYSCHSNGDPEVVFTMLVSLVSRHVEEKMSLRMVGYR